MNPYDEYKQKNNLVKYLCNQCSHELGKFDIDGKQAAMDMFMGALGGGASAPAAFYCKNNKCKHFGLLTKVAIKK